ncbi:C1 family peptidase [Hymenobacter mucosus]|nr:C1 family peptidase [Hymenobacter mucosus]
MHNVLNNNADESSSSFKAFSYGFVASKMKMEKPWRIRIRSKCGLKATADHALRVLAGSGTVEYKYFKDYCACNKVDAQISQAQAYRTKQHEELDRDVLTDLQYTEKIKDFLKLQVPVVASINQIKAFGSTHNALVRIPEEYVKPDDINTNHVVCIIGFNDKIANGSFLIKNNYSNWGKGGFSYISYSDMMKIIGSSYRIVL